MDKKIAMAEATSTKPNARFKSRLIEHPLLRKHFPLVAEDLAATYTRDLHKWLIIAPLISIIRRSRGSNPTRCNLLHSHDPIAPPP